MSAAEGVEPLVPAPGLEEEEEEERDPAAVPDAPPEVPPVPEALEGLKTLAAGVSPGKDPDTPPQSDGLVQPLADPEDPEAVSHVQAV